MALACALGVGSGSFACAPSQPVADPTARSIVRSSVHSDTTTPLTRAVPLLEGDAPASGLGLHQVVARSSTLAGQPALELAGDPAVLAQSQRKLGALLAAMTARGQQPAGPQDFAEVETEHLALVNDIEFANGTIEVELAGVPAPGAPGFARGFVGVAFRVQPDGEHYDCLYLRPSNGRAPEQIRRNHSTQYIAHPDWPWYRLRAESPGHYESYVDLVPGDWTPVKIVVEGERAELYVGGAAQPTLVVADLKSGPAGKGKVALWIHASTVGHFRNLRITPR